jgi:type II secretory pathway pseudopilin PulG
MKLSSSFRRSRQPEQGYVLMVILLMMALLLVALVAIAPRMATEIRREREEETIRRGKQYATAVKRYFKKFGRYPTSIEQLENTNNMRFLRKRYKDPMTGQDFRILHFGEQKSVPKGLFGAAIGSSGAGALGGGIGGGMAGGGLPGAIVGNALGGGTGAGPATPGSPAGTGQNQGDQGSQPGVSADSISRPLGGSGPTSGGGPMIGVAGTKNQASLKSWNDKTNYKDWEFYYDPRFDVQGAGAQGIQGVGGIPGMPGQPGAGPNPNPNPGGTVRPK